MTDDLRFRCGCRPYVYGRLLFHRRDCPTRSSAALSPAERDEWRAILRAAMRRQARDGNSPVERGEAVALLLADREGYIDAHIDDDDDDGSDRL